ncbi:hematopoietic SH2 domain-containing protein homolog isoform X1 [Rhinichthys klamathensis goyatoka]|uniref:hematopoietic SH2 domain-containing protein homolog isoform X1 n=2 Tax=Rhinichthys klamathensis goyatoka TaxID=3034132 RepID=UPI0024B59670|nr:hematopoietic SH2 domain-containing protein homolog isoform X1 [Rhinichthys klamathensis goyatoka]
MNYFNVFLSILTHQKSVIDLNCTFFHQTICSFRTLDVMAVPLPCDSSDAAFAWFTEFQRSSILTNGIVPEWFHGIISRKAAEDELKCKPPGYFLIRVSESRVGYTLSYRAEDRFRHFMIDVLPDNQFIIVGESTHYRSLHDLVAFHRRSPILPYNELLTVACEQGGKTNYAELFLPRKKELNAGQVEWINSPTQAHTPRSDISEHNATSALQTDVPALPSSPSARLYPSLETELTTLNLQSTDQPTKPVPKPRTIFTSTTHDTPPQLPPRMCLPSRPQATAEADRSQGLTSVSPDKHQIAASSPVEGRTQQKNQQHLKPVVLSLAQIKKKLKKKHSEDHTYEEIPKDACQEDPTLPAMDSSTMNPKQQAENEYQELSDCRSSDGIPNFADRELPYEYLNPPPFAPGY